MKRQILAGKRCKYPVATEDPPPLKLTKADKLVAATLRSRCSRRSLGF